MSTGEIETNTVMMPKTLTQAQLVTLGESFGMPEDMVENFYENIIMLVGV